MKTSSMDVAAPEPRKGMPSPQLDEAAFTERYRSRFNDPAFDPLRGEIDRIVAVAWDAYTDGRKAPVTEKAGPGYADPNYELSVDWRAAHEMIEAARMRYADAAGPSRILVINGSSRSEHSCPGEMSKSFRLASIAQGVFDGHEKFETTMLDLSRLTSEFGARSIRARPVSRRRRRCVTFRAAATPTIRWVKSTTG